MARKSNTRDLTGRFQAAKFDVELGEKAIRLRQDGAGWPEIAQQCGVDRSTLYRWRTPGAPGYNEEFAVLAKEATAMLVEDVIDSILDVSYDPDLVDRDSAAAARTKVESRALWLKTVAPDRFVQKTDVTSGGEKLAHQKVIIVPAGVDPNDIV